jgi:trehalose 6-phosphate phosphatase
MEDFVGLDLKTTALLLDVDGTILDIGPSPFNVYVSDDLRDSLGRLSDLTGGAMALVSGRPVKDLDQLFEPLKLPAVGGHGAEVRIRENSAVSRIADLPVTLRQQLIALALSNPGIEYEDKGYSVAFHYRQVPKLAECLRRHINMVCATFPYEATEILIGKAVLEVKRPSIDKGEAVRALMMQKPFAGRTPVFLGDDVTDESVFGILPELGGKGFAVARHFPHLVGMFASPHDVRLALQRLAFS